MTTGAYQTEGNNLASDWWASENAPDTTIDEPPGDADDGYHRWRDDMDLAAAAEAEPPGLLGGLDGPCSPRSACL